MPRLGETKTEKIYLPTTKDEPNEDDRAYVIIRETILLGDLSSMSNDLSDIDNAINLLAMLITDWNFTEDGTPATSKLPINEEWISKLNVEDFAYLSEAVAAKVKTSMAGLADIEKKTLPLPSPQTPTTAVS